VSREPAAVRERYGSNVNGMSFLMARRLVKAAVPFVMGIRDLIAKDREGRPFDVMPEGRAITDLF
jgi:hypothetical protein